MQIYSAGIILSLLALLPQIGLAQHTVVAQGNCLIIYALKRSANDYFNDEIAQLSRQVAEQDMYFIDLNNWGKAPPHIEVSGRTRNKLRSQFDLNQRANQVVLIDEKGEVTHRYTGSVTLVNVLLDCQTVLVMNHQ